MELTSVSVVPFKLGFIVCELIIASMLSIGDASKDVFVFSVMFVNVNG